MAVIENGCRVRDGERAPAGVVLDGRYPAEVLDLCELGRERTV